jgi:hypothetical protein
MFQPQTPLLQIYPIVAKEQRQDVSVASPQVPMPIAHTIGTWRANPVEEDDSSVLLARQRGQTGHNRRPGGWSFGAISRYANSLVGHGVARWVPFFLAWVYWPNVVEYE